MLLQAIVSYASSEPSTAYERPIEDDGSARSA
jgi:hypothetical protein